MTVSNETLRSRWAGDGSANDRTTEFVVFASSEITIIKIVVATSVESPLTEGVDYTVTLPAALPGLATITPLAVIPSGTDWIAWRDSADTQGADYASTTGFNAAGHEAALDRAALHDQEIRGLVSRSLHVEMEEDDADAVMALGRKAARLGNIIQFDAVTGLPNLVDVFEPGTLSVSSWIESNLLPKTTLSAVQTLLEIILNGGNVAKLQAGTDAGKPSAAALGAGGFYWATDAGKLYSSDGAALFEMGVGQFAYASLPAATTAGRIILDKENFELLYDDSSNLNLIRPLPPNHLSGCQLSWTDADTMAVTSGWARNTGDNSNGRLAASMSKETAGALWTSGAVGCCVADGLLAADTLFAVYLIWDDDGTNVDWGIDSDLIDATNLLGSTNATASYYRRLGYVRTDPGSTDLLEWGQDGDHFWWETPQDAIELNAQDWTAAGGLVTVDFCPPNVLADLHFIPANATAGIPELAVMGQAGQDLSAALATLDHPVADWNELHIQQPVVKWIRVDSNSQFRYKVSNDASSDLAATIFGWIDDRGKNA